MVGSQLCQIDTDLVDAYGGGYGHDLTRFDEPVIPTLCNGFVPRTNLMRVDGAGVASSQFLSSGGCVCRDPHRVVRCARMLGSTNSTFGCDHRWLCRRA